MGEKGNAAGSAGGLVATGTEAAAGLASDVVAGTAVKLTSDVASDAIRHKHDAPPSAGPSAGTHDDGAG
jgi:hypothetical protein